MIHELRDWVPSHCSTHVSYVYIFDCVFNTHHTNTPMLLPCSIYQVENERMRVMTDPACRAFTSRFNSLSNSSRWSLKGFGSDEKLTWVVWWRWKAVLPVRGKTKLPLCWLAERQPGRLRLTLSLWPVSHLHLSWKVLCWPHGSQLTSTLWCNASGGQIL